MSQSGDKPDAPTPTPQEQRPIRRVIDLLVEVLAVLLVLGALFLLVWPSCQVVIEASKGHKSIKNLKEIGLAIHQFTDENGQLPANTVAADGRPLLSWRVHILPF